MAEPRVELLWWTEDHVEQLIALYEEHPCLYDNKSKDYSDRDIRSTAVKEIAAAMEATGQSGRLRSVPHRAGNSCVLVSGIISVVLCYVLLIAFIS